MKEPIFAVKRTRTAFNVLKNGRKIGSRKTYLGAVARALICKYREQNKPKRGAK